MITINLGGQESFNEETNEFIETTKGKDFRFEHSLKAIADWESEYRVPYLTQKQLTDEQFISYMVYMCLDEGFEKSMINLELVTKLSEYIGEHPTATNIQNENKPGGTTVVTSEVIYSYLVNYDIPWVAETWNINRLMTLISIIGIQRSPKKNKPTRDVVAENARLNAERKLKFKTEG